jgi:hypothetical protein
VNRRRGRPAFSRPQRVGRLELAVFVLVPVIPAVLRRQPGDVLATILGNLVLAALVYVVTSYGLVSLLLWVLGRLLRQTAIVVGLLARALPLLLLIVGLLFLTAELWQSVGSQTGAGYTAVLWLFGGLALAFLATTLTRELPTLRGFSSWEEVERLVVGTPAEHLLAAPARLPLEAVPAPTWRQRFNAAVVLFATQTIQVALVSLLLGIFLTVFGLCAVPLGTIEAWTGAPPRLLGYAWVGDATFPVTEEMLRVVGFLTAFTTLYFSVASLTDATYRRQFYEDAAGQLRRAFAVRAVYLTMVVPAASHAGEAGPDGGPRASPAGPARGARPDEPGLVGVDHGLHPVPQGELGEDAADVRLDGRLPHDEVPRDLGVREATADEDEHLSLARGEGVDGGGRGRGRR